MKYLYLVVFEKKNEKYLSSVIKVSQSENMTCIFERFPDMIALNYRPTKKEAIETADFWNQCAFKNGNYYFQEDNRIWSATVLNN